MQRSKKQTNKRKNSRKKNSFAKALARLKKNLAAINMSSVPEKKIRSTLLKTKYTKDGVVKYNAKKALNRLQSNMGSSKTIYNPIAATVTKSKSSSRES